MSVNNDIYQSLRKKLDILGYTQTLPLPGIPLISGIFDDLIKTTESLRDSKQKIVELLEEKSCWELGTEAYKCDNARLIAECNQLHHINLSQREEYEKRIFEFNQKLRILKSEKQHLEEQCSSLQLQLKSLLPRSATTTAAKVSAFNMKYGKEVKKPFVSTVRSGGELPPVKPVLEEQNNELCNKCQTKTSSSTNVSLKANVEKLEHSVKDLMEEIEYYKRKVEARDREITRLNNLLSGGRPPAALAKDCCYKDINALTEDIKLLQNEKLDSFNRMRAFQEEMHEAMTRALQLEKQNKELRKELDELKKAALHVETQANAELSEREEEIEKLQSELKRLRNKNTSQRLPFDSDTQAAGDNINICEENQTCVRINEAIQRENDLKFENEMLHKKLHKSKTKITTLQKELFDVAKQKETGFEEEKIRLKSERDFFQKEFLRLMSKTGSDKEIDFLQSQIKSKDEELRTLRSELCIRTQLPVPPLDLPSCPTKTVISACPSQPLSARSATSVSSDCVQAAVLRAERERDCARTELERVRCERDTLREKHLCIKQQQMEESQHAHQHIDALNIRIKQIEKENHELNSARFPTETQIIVLKDEIEDLKRRTCELQEENCKLKINNKQMQILQEQVQRSLIEYQQKLLIAEEELKTADIRQRNFESNRETSSNEVTQLRSEIASLKHTYVALENEKDKILNQLDLKTERSFQLEYQLRSCQEKRNYLEKQVRELEEQLENLNTKKRVTEIHETSSEIQNLRHQIIALKTSRDAAIMENSQLSDRLANCQAEICMLKKKVSDSEVEINRMKQQLRIYVQEVKKAEDLLTAKEKEREEMLEHYRSLSHDAVLLEGNNQSLEVEAAEYKCQISELESEVESLKKEICCRNGIIEQLEDKISALTKQISKLEKVLEEALDEQRLLKVDLAMHKELCDKLDVQREKFNAELLEFNEIRRKLENDNERLRNEIEKSNHGQKASSESFEELLSKTRRDLEEQIQIDTKMSQELLRMRSQNDNLLRELEIERQKREKQELITKEFQVQNQELRHNITDDLFRQARSREQTPRLPSSTL